MTNAYMLRTAMAQSAIESNCRTEDFVCGQPVVTESVSRPGVRKYLRQPLLCDFTSYGNNVVATVRRDLMEPVKAYLSRVEPEHCFETPNIHMLERELNGFDLKICFMAEYFLPDMKALRALECPLEVRLLEPADFAELYLPQWSNALCEKRKHLDRLAVGAYDGGRLIGMAGASADCDSMWQIGIDVLPEYRRQGIASALTSRLALEILERDKVPFYCAAWCNIPSGRNAIRSGFRPAWVQMTAWETAFVDDMLKG